MSYTNFITSNRKIHMPQNLMFSYGTNTHPQQMAQRCPGATCLGPAILPGFRFVWRKHADIELDDTNYVDGVVWEIDDQHLDDLDLYEGFPDYYLRHRVMVNMQGNRRPAWVYTMSDQSSEQPPSRQILNICMTGYEDNGLPTDQIQRALENMHERS